ncbi:MAG TPA: CBS domain-containing protein [Casimicrobiaceae bacterium]|nr:CBS domain-containing protein [Casimicrobiaceae bacterium]
MLVRERMSSPVVTVSRDTTHQKALELMQQKRLRRLPVLDRARRLVGIVAERDLLLAATRYPSAAIEVGEVMATRLVTASPGMDLTGAARLMLEHRVGGLPVVEDGALVGIITESDIFRRFVESQAKSASDPTFAARGAAAP